MSDSVQPHRRPPARLPHLWDSPGKNIGVGCHFPLQCMKVKSESEVAQSSLTLSDPMDCSLPGSSIHGIFQARVLELYRRPKSTWKDAQHHYLLDKCKSKLQWCITSYQWKWPLLKSLYIINAEEGVGKRESSYSVERNVNWYSYYE